MQNIRGVIVIIAFGASSIGSAQPPAGTAPAPRERAPVDGAARSDRPITVTGERSTVQSSIDRLSYSIANDLQGTTGSVADVLRNVPSVEVDPDGNVSLRGDPNVVILIDGQPSGALRGPNRGANLQALPANRYERVEVMTKPSAAFGPEGSGGVINLIPRRTRQAGLSGSARLNAGLSGRVNGGLNAAWVAGDTTVSGDIGARRDELSSLSDRSRERLDPGSGLLLESIQSSRSDTATISGNLRLGVEHALDRVTRLSTDFTGLKLRSDSDGREVYEAESAAPGSGVEQLRTFDASTRLDNRELRARLARSFGTNDHRLTIDAAWQGSESDRTLRSLISVSSPAPGEIVEDFRFGVDQDQLSLRTDYARPFGDGSRLQTGYEFERQDNEYQNVAARGPDGQPLQPLPSINNRFRHRQIVMGLYGTYERTFGRVTALAGLRLEQVELNLDQVTTGSRFARDYFRFYPTLHVSYRLTEAEQLRASFSRRVQRPQGQDLNPFSEYRDPFNFRAGNPDLRPQRTDLGELAWQRRAGTTFYQAALFYRSTRRAFTDVIRDLGGGAFLTTRENLGESRAIGIELVVNQRFGSTLTLNATATGAWNEIDARSLGFSAPRSAFQLGGRASLNWRASERDHFQLSGFLTGRSVRPQGYRAAGGMLNLGYRRQLGSSLSLVATVRDLLGNFGEVFVYDIPTLRDRVERRLGGRIVFVGLAYVFGGNQRNRREQNFDFEAGRTE